MKILEISSCFPPSRGGVERCVFQLSTRFAADGHEVTVVTSSRGLKPKKYVEKVGSVKVVRLPEKYHLFEAPLIPRIALAALTSDYDVLHIHGMSPTITDLGIIFAKLRGKKVVLTYHNDAESHMWPKVTKLTAFIYSSLSAVVVRLADVIVSSTASYARTSPALRLSLHKLKIIPMGVDLERFEPYLLPQARNTSKSLLFVGQLKDYKGVDVLLDSLAILKSKGHEIPTDIVGAGPSLQRLVSKAQVLGIEDYVRFRGNVDDQKLLELYANCHSVVLPSLGRREAFGIVLLEAMAAGKCVIASDIPGVNEVATLGDGYLAKPNNPKSLADTILVSLQNGNHPERQREIVRKFTWDNIARKYESIFRSLLKGD